MSATNKTPRLMQALEPYCTHGISLSKPCLECEEFVRRTYPEYAPEESGTVQ